MYKDFLGLQSLVVVEAGYELSDDESATLILKGCNGYKLSLVVIHESASITKQKFAGNESSERLIIRNNEGLIILAKRRGEIIACGVFQVNLGNYDSISSILIPVATSSLELMQSDAAMMRRATERALESVEAVS